MKHCSGGCDWYVLSPVLLMCTKCGFRLRFASAAKLGALVRSKEKTL